MFSFRPTLAHDPVARAAEVVGPRIPELLGQLGNQEVLRRFALLGVGAPADGAPIDRLASGRPAPMDPVAPGSAPVFVADGGVGAQKKVGARELAAKVANGEVTGQVGWGTDRAGGGIAVSSSGVVTAIAKGGGEAVGLDCALSADMDPNGVGSWSGRLGVNAGPGSVHVGGGDVADREVQALPNGRFKARVYAGKGASLGARIAPGAAVCEGDAMAGAAALVEAEFDTAAEAEAFAASQDPTRTTWAADELDRLVPGERLRRELSVEVVQKASVTDGLKAAIGLEANAQASLELERRDDGQLRVTRAHEAGLGGSCGVGVLGLLGLDGECGFGVQSREAVDFDLDQPGARAAFEAYQLTGSLPDPLPAGVTRAESTHTTSWRDLLDATLPCGTHERERVLREGEWVGDDGRSSSLLESEVRDTQTWGGPILGELDKAEAVTVARLMTPHDECGGETLDVKTAFSGRGAAARAADLATPGLTSSEARARHGDASGATTVDTHLEGDHIDDLGFHMAMVRIGKATLVQDEIDESAFGARDRRMAEFTDAEGDPGALVHYLLAGGSAAHEHIVNNDKGVTEVRSSDAPSGPQAEASVP